MSMKIAHVVPFAARVGGYEKQGLLLARAQAEEGHALRLITHADHASRLDCALLRPIRVYGVSHRVGLFNGGDVERAIGDAEVIHLHALDPLAGAVAQAALRLGIPFVVKVATEGDVTHFNAGDAATDDEHRGKIRDWMQRRAVLKAWDALRRADTFVALNKAIASELEATGVETQRVLILPNAVEIPPSRAPFRPRAERAIHIGRLEARKRVDHLIEALALVRQAVPGATLSIVGDGPERERLEELAAGHKGIEFTGEVADPSHALGQADVFVFASEREGCPNALLEAAARGLACAATAISGVRDWFEDGVNMRLVPPGDPEAMADAWIDLLTDSTERLRLGDAARARVERAASLPRLVERYFGVYAKMRSAAALRQAAAIRD